MNLLNGIAARYAQAWGDQVHAHDAALKQLWQLAFREAQVQTFADAYLAIAICFAVAFLMVPFRHAMVGLQATAFKTQLGPLLNGVVNFEKKYLTL
jgi:hypothetical protein